MLMGAIAVVITGVASAILVSLCAAGIIGPNPVVGIRMPALISSEEAWRVGHRSAVLPTWLAAFAACALGASAALVAPLNEWGLVLTVAPVLAGLVWGAVRGSLAANALLDRAQSD